MYNYNNNNNKYTHIYVKVVLKYNPRIYVFTYRIRQILLQKETEIITPLTKLKKKNLKIKIGTKMILNL